LIADIRQRLIVFIYRLGGKILYCDHPKCSTPIFKPLNKAHNFLCAKSPRYHNWHHHPHHKKVHFGTLMIVLTLIVGLLINSMPQSAHAQTPNFTANWDSASLDADSGPGGVTATNDGAPASIVTPGYNSSAGAVDSSGTKTLKYPLANNLNPSNGAIEAKFKLPYAVGMTRQFSPSYIAYDNASDSIYFTDTLNNRIVKTNITGSVWQTFGDLGPGEGEFNNPKSISFDSATGFIYVADSGNNRIVKTKIDGSGWTTLGSFGTAIGRFKYPSVLTHDTSTDYLYVVDSSNDRIVKTKMDASGWEVLEGQFHNLNGITYDSTTGDIYATDPNNNCIIKTKIDGSGWITYGTDGSGEGQMHWPQGIAIDPNTKDIYIADPNNNRIIKTKIDGSGWTTYGTSGSGEGQFSWFADVAYNPTTGFIYVADTSNNRIVKTKIDGTGWATYTSEASASGQRFNNIKHIAYDSTTKNIYIADTSNNRIVKTNIDGSVWETHGVFDEGGDGGVGEFRDLTGQIAFDSTSGYIYVVDRYGRRIVRTKMDGEGWVALTSDTIGLNADIGAIAVHSMPNPDDNIIYTSGDNGGPIFYSFKMNGTVVSSATVPGYVNNGIAIDPQSNPADDIIYGADPNSGQIVKTNVTGTDWHFYGTFGEADDPGTFYYVYDIAYDATTGYLYLADLYNSHIVKTKLDLDGEGNPLWTGWTTYGSYGSGVGQFDFPQGIAFDSITGFIYVADNANNRIVKTKIDGTDWEVAGEKHYKTLFRTSGDNPMWLYLDAQSGVMKFYVSSGGTGYTTAYVKSRVSFDAGSWHSVKVVYMKGGLLQLYIDNALSASKTMAGGWTEPSLGDNFYVGSVAGALATKSLGGTIDELKLYSYDDSIAPPQPENVVGEDTLGGSNTLVSGNWSKYPNPYFSWNASVDTAQAEQDASGTSGYYLYFGPDENADPVATSGLIPSSGSSQVYQLNTNVTVAGALVSGTTYHLLMKTKDYAGNVSDASDLFTYKYDDVTPSTSGSNYLSVSPIGLARTNHFVFSWPAVGQTGGSSDEGAAANPVTGSGIDHFEYRINDTGDWVTVDGGAGATSITLDDIAKKGNNAFALRAVDTAGNVDATPSQTSFMFSDTGLLSPIGLSVNPSDTSAENPDTNNQMTFSWQAPTSAGSLAVDGYYYSINDLPDEITAKTLAGSATSVTAGGTKQGKNFFYIVPKDTTGVTNFDACSSFNGAPDSYDSGIDACARIAFYIQTPAPGIPVALDLTDKSNRDLGKYKINLEWEPPVEQGIGVAKYSVERYETSDTSLTTPPSDAVFAFRSEPSSNSYSESGLDSSKKYFYRVFSVDSAGKKSDPSEIVSVIPTGKFTQPPILTEGSLVSTANAYSAKIEWKTADPDSTIVHTSAGFILFGTDKSNLSGNKDGTFPAEIDYRDSHSIRVTGLEPSTKYYYQAVWRDKDGNEGKSTVESFSTSAASKVESVSVSNITLDSALINFNTTLDQKPISATVNLNYGTSSSYGDNLPTSSTGSSHSFTITGLHHSTEYHFQVSGNDINGDPIKSDDYTFDTLTMPKIDGTVAMDQDKEAPTTTYRFAWKTNIKTTSVIYYQNDKGEKQSKSSPDMVSDHSLAISNLSDQSVYSFEVTGVDEHGIALENSFKTNITTPKDTRAPKVSNMTVEVKSSGFGQTQKAQLVISWETDEPGTSQVEYDLGISGDSYANKSKTDPTYSTSHAVILADMEPSKIYHLRAISVDPSGNVGHSDDTTTITGKMQQSVLDIIVNSLERSLGWMFGMFNKQD